MEKMKVRVAAGVSFALALLLVPVVAYAQAAPPNVGDTVAPVFSDGLSAWVGAVTDLLPYLIAAGLIMGFIGFIVRRFSSASAR